MPLLRLDKIISDSGMASRSEAAALIKRGSVTVGGKTAVSGASKHDPEVEDVAINGVPLNYKKHIYIMMNKPRGYVSAVRDRHEKTVTELLEDKYAIQSLFPAGRLDKDAEGLLILTNDGDFAHKVTSPVKKVNKKYFVEFDGTLTDADIAAFANGLELRDGTRCMPAKLEPVPGGAYVTLREGKYHQVKRMMAATGHKVIYLKRISIGALALDDSLKPGDYRELTDENEIYSLLNETK